MDTNQILADHLHVGKHINYVNVRNNSLNMNLFINPAKKNHPKQQNIVLIKGSIMQSEINSSEDDKTMISAFA